MVKARWLYSKIPIPLSQLSKLMIDSQYDDISGKGFLISAATSTKIVGKYVEKVVQKSLLEDPFGEISELSSVTYYTCQFSLEHRSNLLLIKNPPRTLRKFLNQLHQMTGFGLVVSEIEVDPELWIRAIGKACNSLHILQINSSGIRASQTSSAKISITGTKDVRASFEKMISDKRYMVESMKFEAMFGELEVKGEILRNGTCKFKTANSDLILEKLRRALEVSRR